LDPEHRLDPQPRTSHPGRLLDTHPPIRFGCTPCHGGVGEATTTREAHAPSGCGVRLAGDAAEISCGKCHLNELTIEGAPHLSHGRALIRNAQCDGCHEIGGSPPRDRLGPSLTGIGDRVDPVWLFRWLKNPRDYASNARMPRFELEDKYIDALVGYLMTFRLGTAFDETGFPAGDPTLGGNLLRTSFCISCHAINDKGGTGVIDLGRVGSKLHRPYLLHLLAATHEVDPGTAMPQYRFTSSQIADVVAYLRKELTDPSFESADPASGSDKLGTYWPAESKRVDVGRRLFKELRCGNCHVFPGGEGWIRIGPVLSKLAEKKAADISWGTTTFPRTLAEFVWHKVGSPGVYASAPHQLKMPIYDFTPEEAKDVTIALLAQSEARTPPDEFLVRSHGDESLSLPADFGRLVQRYRCTSCHAVNGIGRNISCDLGAEGSRARREWIYKYLKQPYTIRPMLTARMPIFNLTDEEAGILADGITKYWNDPQIDALGDFPVRPSDPETGRKIFEGSGCLGCHQIGAKGGYVGPSFTSGSPVVERFRSGWLVRWLENAHALKPDVLEPRFGFTRDQAQALAAYLMALPQNERVSSR
jgi:mono/diheme cytochrome c family protein